MENILNISVDDYTVKAGDIKVDSEDLKSLLSLMELNVSVIGNMLDSLSDDERQSFDKFLSFSEFFQNKYIVLNDIRLREHHYFELVKKCDDPKFTKDSREEDIRETKRTVYSWYLDARKKREDLQSELKKYTEERGF